MHLNPIFDDELVKHRWVIISHKNNGCNYFSLPKSQLNDVSKRDQTPNIYCARFAAPTCRWCLSGLHSFHLLLWGAERFTHILQGPFSQSGRTYYHQISRSFKVVTLGVVMITWNMKFLAALCIEFQIDRKKSILESRGYKTSRDLTVRRPSAFWIKTLTCT